ncbi:2-deoxyglucose-6-phosphate phosphatase [Anaeramoeba flamelloides]|uniref:2-deoxyglucose-6-phosphate phosphatase n=1 Tax=Anaeramoeba flamelloides TaxID=1746091 RepID=A0AAV8A6M6_9EUKA|nr:2-deoxyglucose-6-phosphate phosphatase [Anaeramoeba flamelloides]
MSKTLNTSPIKGIIFDVDGLLLDTDKTYVKCFQEIVNEYLPKKKPVISENILANMMGRNLLQSVQLIIDEYSVPIEGQEFVDIVNQRVPPLLPNCNEKKGALKLINYLHKNNIPSALASGDELPNTLVKLENKPWKSYYPKNQIMTGDQVTKGKPDPEIFLKAAESIGIKPENCIVFEDAVMGVKAGISAGMHVVWVPEYHMELEELPKATQILDSLAEFNPQLFGLPKFDEN